MKLTVTSAVLVKQVFDRKLRNYAIVHITLSNYLQISLEKEEAPIPGTRRGLNCEWVLLPKAVGLFIHFQRGGVYWMNTTDG